jgi:hypothetical protein
MSIQTKEGYMLSEAPYCGPVTWSANVCSLISSTIEEKHIVGAQGLFDVMNELVRAHRIQPQGKLQIALALNKNDEKVWAVVDAIVHLFEQCSYEKVHGGFSGLQQLLGRECQYGGILSFKSRVASRIAIQRLKNGQAAWNEKVKICFSEIGRALQRMFQLHAVQKYDTVTGFVDGFRMSVDAVSSFSSDSRLQGKSFTPESVRAKYSEQFTKIYRQTLLQVPQSVPPFVKAALDANMQASARSVDELIQRLFPQDPEKK